jgi:hypothetical protein
MDILVRRGVGLDVHQATVAAAGRVSGSRGARIQVIQTFRTTTLDLLAVRAGLTTYGVTHVAPESTGISWKPIYYVLETVARSSWRIPPTFGTTAAGKPIWWMVPGSSICGSAGSCGGASCHRRRSGYYGISPAIESPRVKSGRARRTASTKSWKTPASSSPR